MGGCGGTGGKHVEEANLLTNGDRICHIGLSHAIKFGSMAQLNHKYLNVIMIVVRMDSGEATKNIRLHRLSQ